MIMPKKCLNASIGPSNFSIFLTTILGLVDPTFKDPNSTYEKHTKRANSEETHKENILVEKGMDQIGKRVNSH